MGRIVYLMGKSSAGKDTIYKRLLEDGEPGLKKIVPYTTRPIRDGERNGVEYFFTDEASFQSLKEQGKIIEDREYHTVQGLWRYFTVNDSQLWAKEGCLMIGTLEAYGRLRAVFGEGRMLPILVEVDDGIRLKRALEREFSSRDPQYREMCRRFLADSEDYSEERIREAGIVRRFVNNDLEDCVKEIRVYIGAVFSEDRKESGALE